MKGTYNLLSAGDSFIIQGNSMRKTKINLVFTFLALFFLSALIVLSGLTPSMEAKALTYGKFGISGHTNSLNDSAKASDSMGAKYRALADIGQTYDT